MKAQLIKICKHQQKKKSPDKLKTHECSYQAPVTFYLYFLLIWRTKYIMNSNPSSVILSARGNGLALLISYPAMTYFFPAKTSLISTPFPTLASQIGRQTQLRSMVIYSMGTRFCQTSSQCGRIGRFLWNKIITGCPKKN